MATLPNGQDNISQNSSLYQHSYPVCEWSWLVESRQFCLWVRVGVQQDNVNNLQDDGQEGEEDPGVVEPDITLESLVSLLIHIERTTYFAIAIH